MNDIKYPPFDMKDFRGIPRNRPLYAAICTILDHSKDKNVKEAAVKAAEEYQKLTVLEQHMLSQNMMTTVSFYFTLQMRLQHKKLKTFCTTVNIENAIPFYG